MELPRNKRIRLTRTAIELLIGGFGVALGILGVLLGWYAGDVLALVCAALVLGMLLMRALPDGPKTDANDTRVLDSSPSDARRPAPSAEPTAVVGSSRRPDQPAADSRPADTVTRPAHTA